MPSRLYLKPDEFVKKNGVHTHYAAERAVRTNSDEPIPQLHRLQFVHGVATNVPDDLAKRMKAEGIASDTRAPRREEE